MNTLLDWLQNMWLLWLPLLAGFFAVWMLLPQIRWRPRAASAVLGVSALLMASTWVLPAEGAITLERVLFYVFAAATIVAAVCMITNRNPCYAALWFAVVTLGTCGLFLLRSAPFLAAATVIVYAGAIVVTFLFVIMLAQQAGQAEYDQVSREPFWATLISFVLLGALVHTLQGWGREHVTVAGDGAVLAADVAPKPSRPAFLPVPAAIRSSPLSQPQAGEPLGTMRGLGRSLFGDFLYAVELAGTLLLVASIGAIAIAPRRSQGTL